MAKYFSEDEFKCKCCGELPANGIDENLQELLDDIRERVGQPIILNCCYRCDSHNAEVGGVKGSQHNADPCTAADIDASEIGVEELAQIAESLGADGVGRYFGDAGTFVHVDVRSGRIGDNYRWNEGE